MTQPNKVLLAVAAIISLEPPGWDADEICRAATHGWLGLFVIRGLMIRRVTVGKRASCELFGPGDLIRPWDTDGEYAPLPISVDWHVLEPTRLAVLDTAFALRIARWPSITSRIVGRVAQRARYLALTQAVTHLPVAERAGDDQTAVLAEASLDQEEAAAEVLAGAFDRALAVSLGERPSDPMAGFEPSGDHDPAERA